MKRHLHHLVFLSTIVAMLLAGASGSTWLLAQDPFGGENAVAPAGPMAPMAPGEAKNGEVKKPTGPPLTDDVIILSLRESKPTAPAQLVDAARKMADYGALDEARRYLTQLIATKPDVSTLAGLQRQFGSNLFLEFMTNKGLAPEGLQVGKAVLESARVVNDDPARLKTLAKQATSADVREREEAISELNNAGVLAVAPLVEILANKNLPEAQARARDALVALGSDTVEPLIGVLEASDPDLRVQTMAVLTRLQSPRVIPFLLRPALDTQENPRVQAMAREALKRLTGGVPSKADVETYLSRKVNDYLGGAWPIAPDADKLVTLWRWDSAQNASVPHHHPATMSAIISPELRTASGQVKTIEEVPASIVSAALIARDLYRLFPESAYYRRLFLVTHLEAAKLMSGIGQPLPKGPSTVHALASLVGVEALEDAFTWAIKNDHLPAAIAAAEVLGDIGDASLLATTAGEPRPLALALRHPNRRLRFTAANAILNLKPDQSFPGASFVPETLGFIAGTVGSKRVLIVDPRGEEAGVMAGLFQQLGYEADIAFTGKQGLAKALKQPDYELIVLGDGIAHSELDDTWQQLRKDPRTAEILVAVIAREENMIALLEKAEADPLARTMPQPHTVDTLAFQLRQLFAKAGPRFVPHEERQRQATIALDHLAALAKDAKQSKQYDLFRQEEPLIRALENSHLTVHAAPALGRIASSAAQRALVNVASDSNYDLVDRQAAAQAFAEAVARRGLLLTTEEIRKQFHLYNASEKLDENTQQVLAGLLDVIEKK